VSLDDLNREQKRQLKKMGALDEQGRPQRDKRQPQQRKKKDDRIGVRQYLREVRDEMRKVAWPKKPEVTRYSIIVMVTVVIYTAFVGGFDYVFSQVSEWFYGQSS